MEDKTTVTSFDPIPRMNRTAHLLDILSEECNEVAKRSSKAMRFGLHEVEPGQRLTNAQRIVEEYAELCAVIEMLEDEGLLHVPDLTEPIAAKKAKVEQYLRYSDECGTLTGSAT